MFTIPNGPEAAYAPQAQVDSVDLDILVAGIGHKGVELGCAVSPKTPPQMAVAVEAGIVVINGEVTVAAGDLLIGAAHPDYGRFDLVVVSQAGTKSVVAGTPAPDPVFPVVPTNSVALAAVYVPAGAVSIQAANIVDKRVFVPAPLSPSGGGAAVYGDGSDGTIILDGTTDYTSFSTRSGSTYTLTRDVLAQDLTVQTGVTLRTAGYRVFVRGTLTNQGTISHDGGNGGNGTASAGGAAGSGAVGGTTSNGATNGGAGGTPSSGAGGSAPNASAMTASGATTSGSVGGTGGAGGTATGAGGSGGNATLPAEGRAVRSYPFAVMCMYPAPGSSFLVRPGAGAGGGGGGAASSSGGGGGGGGGGVVVIVARYLVNHGTISARGGAGGNAHTSGNGAGGGGGGGGAVVLAYESKSGGGTVTVAGGAGGSGTGTGQNGQAGGSGMVIELPM